MTERPVWQLYVRNEGNEQTSICHCDTVQSLLAVVAALAALGERGPRTMCIEMRMEECDGR